MIDATQAVGYEQLLQNPGSSKRKTELDNEGFMSLLIAQLANQDPLAPMESQEFAAQLAQFSSLESLQNIDEKLGMSLEAEMLSTQAVNNTMAASLIGREIVAAGEHLLLKDGEATIDFELADAATAVTVTILGEQGEIVQILRYDNLPEGKQSVTWDGLDRASDQVADGQYQLRVTAFDEDGAPVAVRTTITGIITGVSYEGGSATLIVGDTTFPMGDVVSIRMPGDE